MSRCHYVYDREAGRVLIPGCWAKAINEEADCNCSDAGPEDLAGEIEALKHRIAKLEARE